MSNDWEDDDMFDEEETTDMGDDLPKSTAVKSESRPDAFPVTHSRERARGKPEQQGKGKRTVRVRPMSPGMIAKWPDIVSCLLTLQNGKQVMFVKGG